MNQPIERRAYTQRAYSPEEISDAISTFMAEGGSIIRTRETLKNKWGFSPTEPTLRKWLQSSSEAMVILDERTTNNLLSDVTHIIELTYDKIVSELENNTFPTNKLSTLYGTMLDKYIILAKMRIERAKQNSSDIIGDELVKSDIVDAIIKSGGDYILNSDSENA